MSEIDPELRERIDEPASEEAERDARLTPAEAVGQMRINVPAQRSRKLRALLERVNADDGLKADWHVANVNAVKRLGIDTDLNDDVVRRLGLELGWVDVKVAAIDETWSGQKFVRRSKDR